MRYIAEWWKCIKDKLMGKGNNGPYIRQLAENENLYSYLQRQTLEEVHRLSGKVWTDFNAHDPGVTLADIANYAFDRNGLQARFRYDGLPDRGRWNLRT